MSVSPEILCFLRLPALLTCTYSLSFLDHPAIPFFRSGPLGYVLFFLDSWVHLHTGLNRKTNCRFQNHYVVIVFKIAKHAFLAGLSQAVFLASLAFGMFTGLTYSASTPDLYKNQKHGGIGWIIFFLAFGLSSAQILRAAVILFLRREKDVPFSARLRHLLNPGSISHSEGAAGEYELVGNEVFYEDERVDPHNQPMSGKTVVEDEEDLQRRAIVGHHQQQQGLCFQDGEAAPQFWRRPHRQEMSLDLHRHGGNTSAPRAFRNDSHGGESSRTASSDETLHDGHGEEGLTRSPGIITPPLPYDQYKGAYQERTGKRSAVERTTSRASILQGVAKYGEIFLWRVMVLLGWTAFLTGCITYWGGCRSPYIVSWMSEGLPFSPAIRTDSSGCLV